MNLSWKSVTRLAATPRFSPDNRTVTVKQYRRQSIRSEHLAYRTHHQTYLHAHQSYEKNASVRRHYFIATLRRSPTTYAYWLSNAKTRSASVSPAGSHLARKMAPRVVSYGYNTPRRASVRKIKSRAVHDTTYMFLRNMNFFFFLSYRPLLYTAYTRRPVHKRAHT